MCLKTLNSADEVSFTGETKSQQSHCIMLFLLFKLIITGSTPPISVNLHRLKGNNNCETGVDYGQCLNFGQSDPATLPVV